MPKVTPTWLDEILEREEITAEDYYEAFDVERKDFWEIYWLNEDTFKEMFEEEFEGYTQMTIDEYMEERERAEVEKE